MIGSFKAIGKEILDNAKESKKVEFLKSITIVPKTPSINSKHKDCYYEIVYNLDTENREIEIKLGSELSNENRYKFLGFELPAPKASKIFFTTNNFYYHLFTVPDTIRYLTKEKICENCEFMEVLEKLEKDFYDTYIKPAKDEKTSTCLKIEVFKENQRGKIFSYALESISKIKKETYEKLKKEYPNNSLLNFYAPDDIKGTGYILQNGTPCNLETIEAYKEVCFILEKDLNEEVKKAIGKFIYNDLLKIQSKDWNMLKLNIFSLKLDDKYIHEIDDFKSIYFDAIYHSFKEKNFGDEAKVCLCSMCGAKDKDVTGKIDIPTKFYIIDKPYFFENLQKDNSYKSFALCGDCYEEIIAGISYVDDKLHSTMFKGVNYYVIPKNADDLNKTSGLVKKITRILGEDTTKADDDLSEVKSIQRLEDVNTDLIVDFLFFYKDQAAFNVIDNINDVSYSRIEEVINTLAEIENRFLYDILKFKPVVNDLYFYLFPSYYSHDKVDNKVYRKEIVSFFTSILKGRTVSYENLISKFNYIFRKTFYSDHSGKEDKATILYYRPTKMNILITWLNKITKIKGGFNIMEGSSAIEIGDKDIKEFFDIHKDTYGNNFYRQGLFLLGKLINSVKREQESGNKTMTILNKINFDGIPVRRLKSFILDVSEALKIYDLFKLNNENNENNENNTYSSMMDRLQGIEESSMSKDEVVFYILSGISFGSYLGLKKALENKNTGDNNNE